MIHPDTEMRFISTEIGFGVVATRFIPRGTLIWTLCQFDRIYSQTEAASLPAAYHDVLGRYAYLDVDANYVLCWDAGRYINHSCDPAMLGVDRGFEIAVRDLQPGDPVTCEYGSLNLTGKLVCRCQSPLCRGTIGGSDVLRLGTEWDARVEKALEFASKVPQPLLAFSTNAKLFNEYANGLKSIPSYLEHYAGPDIVGDTMLDSGQPWSMAGQVLKKGV
jgi:hypothetical protein